ncbi:MAG: DUF2191 domain-containing protein [Planctomycetota bacterium]
MKTTVELPDHLLSTLHAMAARERTTFRALLVSAVQQFLGSRSGRGGSKFHLRDCAVAGRGVTKPFRGADWHRISAAIYEARRGGASSR